MAFSKELRATFRRQQADKRARHQAKLAAEEEAAHLAGRAVARVTQAAMLVGVRKAKVDPVEHPLADRFLAEVDKEHQRSRLGKKKRGVGELAKAARPGISLQKASAQVKDDMERAGLGRVWNAFKVKSGRKT
jgi:hypothetical protein